MRGGVALLMAGLAGPGVAQETPPQAGPLPGLVVDPAATDRPAGAVGTGPAMVPVVVIDPDRLFRDSAFGRASAARINAELAALVAENRRFEAELEAEERDLTARRATLPPEEFRALAAAFDAKAEAIRSAQDEKDRAISEARQADQQRFLQGAAPELARMMSEMGAVAVLDKQVVFLSFDSIDITDRAILRIDAAIGDGTAPPAP